MNKKVKASSYITQYPVLRTVQSALHFTSVFTQTPFWLLLEASSQLMREGCSYTYPPLPIVRYSFIQQRELEQCREKNLSNVLTPQHRIRSRFPVVESPKLYPIAYYKCNQPGPQTALLQLLELITNNTGS